MHHLKRNSKDRGGSTAFVAVADVERIASQCNKPTMKGESIPLAQRTIRTTMCSHCFVNRHRYENNNLPINPHLRCFLC